MADVKNLIVKVMADASGLANGLGKATSSLDNFKRQAAIAAAAIGAAFVAFSAKSLVAFAEAERAQRGLASALRATGANVDAVLPSLQRLQNDIQRLTKYEDDQVAAAQRLGVTLRIPAAAMDEATRAAVGLAGKFGVDLNQAMQMVAQASAGNFRKFREFIPEINHAATETEKLDMVNRAAAEGMQMAKDEADTLGGSWERMGNIVGDVMEEVGKGIWQGIQSVEAFGKTGRDLVAFLGSDAFKGQMVKIFTEVGKVVANLALLFIDVLTNFLDMVSKFGGGYGAIIALGGALALASQKAAILAGAILSVVMAYKSLQVLSSADEIAGDAAYGRTAQRRIEAVQQRIASGEELNRRGGMSPREYQDFRIATQTELGRYQAELAKWTNDIRVEAGQGQQAQQELQRMVDALKAAGTGMGNLSGELAQLNAMARSGVSTPVTLNPGRIRFGTPSATGDSAGGSSNAEASARSRKNQFEEIWRAYDEMENEWMEEGRREEEERLKRVRKVIADAREAYQGLLANFDTPADAINRKLKEIGEQIRGMITVGAISASDGMALFARYTSDAEKQMASIAGNAKDAIGATKVMASAAKVMEENVKGASTAISDVAQRLVDDFQGGLTDAIMSSVEAFRDGTASMADIWNNFTYNMGETIVRQVVDKFTARMVQKMGIDRGLDYIFGSDSKTGSSAGWLSSLGSFLGFAEGGFVTGGVPGRDSVPAMLTPGELVLTRNQQAALSGGQQTVININAVDAQSFMALASRNPEAIVAQVQRFVRSGGNLGMARA